MSLGGCAAKRWLPPFGNPVGFAGTVQSHFTCLALLGLRVSRRTLAISFRRGLRTSSIRRGRSNRRLKLCFAARTAIRKGPGENAQAQKLGKPYNLSLRTGGARAFPSSQHPLPSPHPTIRRFAALAYSYWKACGEGVSPSIPSFPTVVSFPVEGRRNDRGSAAWVGRRGRSRFEWPDSPEPSAGEQ